MRKIKADCIFVIKISALVFGISLIFLFLAGGEYLFSSDSLASDIIVQELQSTGSLSIHSYVSQQTFWIINFPYWLPEYLLNLFIDNNIITNKIIALVMHILLLVLAYCVAKKYCGNKNVGWLMLCVLGCGISAEWIQWELIEPAYTIHMIYMFVFLLMGNNMVEGIKKQAKNYFFTFAFVLFLVYILSFDQRYAAIFVIPFCVSLLVVTYLESYKAESIKKVDRHLILNVLVIELTIFCATLIGLICNVCIKKILPFSSRLANIESYKFINFESIFEEIATYILSILKLWGAEFSVSVSTLSITSIVYLIKGCICFLLMVAIPSLCTFKYKKLPMKIRVLLIFYWTMKAELFYIYALSTWNSTSGCRYYVYEIPIAVIISSWYLWEYMIKPHNLNRYILVAGMILFCVISQVNIWQDIKNNKELYNKRQRIVAMMQEQDLTYGYATYWNAQILTSISSAEIKILPVTIDNVLVPFYDINYIHQFDKSEHSGKTFLLLSETEYNSVVTNGTYLYQDIGEPKEVLEIEDYVALVYDYNIAGKARYFPYNALYTPIEGAYSVKEVILEKSNVEVGNAGTVNLVKWPIEIDNNSYYKLEFIADIDSETIDWCYADLAKEGYDYSQTTRIISCEDGETNYNVIFYSDAPEDTNNVYLRIVFQNTEPITISQLKVSLLDVY